MLAAYYQYERVCGDLPSASLKVARGVMSRSRGRRARVVGASPLGRARTGVRRVRAVRVAAVNFFLMVGYGGFVAEKLCVCVLFDWTGCWCW